MLRHQWVVHKAREMALHYVSHAGVVYSPEVFIKKSVKWSAYLPSFYSRNEMANKFFVCSSRPATS